MASPAVLMLGIDLHATKATGGRDMSFFISAVDASAKAVTEAGYELKRLDVTPDNGTDLLQKALAEREWDTVMVGGGMRLNPAMTELFEQLLNMVHYALPGKPICFSSGPDTILEAIQRACPT
ncbi:hypothetical protein EV356DRAFT_537730 [Viridothelium virens]|uniref:MoaB/Mog domain-containing protein n=1 Tax=Viridothelium virens TaxID=1048519 RepID=A0A6A6GST7_VIRVR|nr:hypothetical protein EV356DRAFT_537730 [Viridothelium virens]